MEPTVSWSTWEAATSNFGTQTRVEQFEVFSDKTHLNKYLLKEQICQYHWISEYCIWRLLARNFGMCLGEFKCTLQGLLAKNSIFINIWWKIVYSFGCPQFISSRAISSAWEKTCSEFLAGTQNWLFYCWIAFCQETLHGKPSSCFKECHIYLKLLFSPHHMVLSP